MYKKQPQIMLNTPSRTAVHVLHECDCGLLMKLHACTLPEQTDPLNGVIIQCTEGVSRVNLVGGGFSPRVYHASGVDLVQGGSACQKPVKRVRELHAN